MKTLCLIILSVVLFSCQGNCDFVQNEYANAQYKHDQKRSEANELYSKLESIPLDSVSEHSLVEDELNFIMIDIALIEIDMESYKNKNCDCL